jgi:hypothetical protein
LIKKAKITNLNEFLKSNIRTSIILPVEEKKAEKKQFVRRSQSFKPKRSTLTRKNIQDIKGGSIESEMETA